MKPIGNKLLDILREIKKDHFVVPRFQRDFVWDTTATCKLIDSIARNYPIGALLTLPAEALALPCTELKWGDANPLVEAAPGAFYLLDGQQRLTSIARAILSDKTYQYLFDLDAIYRELSDPEMFVNEEWVVCRKKQKKPFTDVGFLRCEDAVQTGLTVGKIMIFLKSKFPDAQDAELAEKSTGLLEVIETVRNYQIIVHQMEKDEKLDSICRIFETINNTGIKLDTFDLIVAKSYSPTYDLREKMNDIKRQYPLVKNFTDESFLHAIHYYTGLVEQKRPTLSKAALLATPPSVWANSIERAAVAFTTLAKWLAQNRLHSSSKGDLVPAALQTIIVACEMLYPGSIDAQVVGVKLKRWLLARLWSSPNYNKTLSEGDLTALKNFFAAPRTACNFTAELPEVVMGEVRAEEVLEAGPNSRRYHVMSAIITANLSQDIFGGILSGGAILEDHHILPKSVCDNLGIPKSDRDSIANRVMVTAQTNGQIIKDHLPSHYFANAKRLLGHEEATRLFEASLISAKFLAAATNYTNLAQFKELLNERAEHIAARLNSYFNIHVASLDVVVPQREPEMALLAA